MTRGGLHWPSSTSRPETCWPKRGRSSPKGTKGQPESTPVDLLLSSVCTIRPPVDPRRIEVEALGLSLLGRGRACPGHPDYSAPSLPSPAWREGREEAFGVAATSRRRRRCVIQRDRNPL